MKPVAALLVIAALAVGCSRPEADYVWVRSEPPAFAASAAKNEKTTFVIRLRVDVGAKKVTWRELVYFRDTKLSDAIREWTNCNVLDENNWDCHPESIPSLGAVEQNEISMRDGRLSQNYWTEQRRYESKRRPWIAE